jgi:uncharacterized protein (TIGR02118 family)
LQALPVTKWRETTLKRRHVVVKVVVLLSRRDGMSREAFERYWRETHLPLVLRVPGRRRFVINWFQADPSGSGPAYDAIAGSWFDDEQAMSTAMTSPEARASNRQDLWMKIF